MIIVRIIGGLGNQMFQYAFYKNLEENFSDVKCDLFGYEKYKLHNGFELEKVFDLTLQTATRKQVASVTNIYSSNILSKIISKIVGLKRSHIKEENFKWELLESNKNYYLDGYWQSDKYFLNDKKCSNFYFKFKQEWDKRNYETYQFITSTNSVSIHVRKGDYVKNPIYFQLNEVYYKSAIELINKKVEKPVFFIFSDDQNWVKAYLLPHLQSSAKHVIFTVIHNSSASIDLRLMSLCKHNIIANSSFSWWSAWLNDNSNKIVISPKNWYNNANDNLKMLSLMPTLWIQL